MLARSLTSVRRGVRTMVTTAETTAAKKYLSARVDDFRRDVERHLLVADGPKILATAWLVTDNVIVDLLARHFPDEWGQIRMLATDTKHLFPETLAVAREMETRYEKPADWFEPRNASTREEFERVYGHAEALDHAKFDQVSKVEPYTRGLRELQARLLITGRRRDQGSERVVLDVFEGEKALPTFNPLAAWSFPEILAYVDEHEVPYSKAHERVFRSGEWICPLQRHRPEEELAWRSAELGKPFWRASEEELRGSEGAEHVFVFKSFGDTHTSVPVYVGESERAGRFVRVANSECGIHTRTAVPGAAHGNGALVSRYVRSPDRRAELIAASRWTLDLDARQACDVELLGNGAMTPLKGFMDEETYEHVLEHMRLPEQQLWGTPVTLDVETAESYAVGDHVLLRSDGRDVAVLKVESVWEADLEREANAVFGTSRKDHPGVAELFARGKFRIGGPIYTLFDPESGLTDVRSSALESTEAAARFLTPRATRERLGIRPGQTNTPVVAFQCRNPIHKAHWELVERALAARPGARALVHPTVGPTQPGDIDGHRRIHTYEALQSELNDDRTVWAYLPFAMRMAGPREALQHAIMRRNFGASAFIVGRDMAGTKSTETGEDFYGPYDARDLLLEHADELGIEIVPSEALVWTHGHGFVTDSEAKERNLDVNKLSGTDFRNKLRTNQDIPSWFAFESVVKVLREEKPNTSSTKKPTPRVPPIDDAIPQTEITQKMEQ